MVAELLDYWREHPPVHELVAAFIGATPRPAPPPPSADDPSGIGGLIRRFPSGRVPADR